MITLKFGSGDNILDVSDFVGEGASFPETVIYADKKFTTHDYKEYREEIGIRPTPKITLSAVPNDTAVLLDAVLSTGQFQAEFSSPTIRSGLYRKSGNINKTPVFADITERTGAVDGLLWDYSFSLEAIDIIYASGYV